jgi:ankyrin repeat protein
MKHYLHPFDATLDPYQEQAAELLAAFRERDNEALRAIRCNLPRFLDEKVPWLPKEIPEEEIRATRLELDDARLALARSYDFADWDALSAYVAAVTVADSPIHRFESAAEAIVNGDVAALTSLLDAAPELITARSSRICKFDPPEHRATLLHYIAANGVEGYRQKTPANAVEIARLLLTRGAEPDALAHMYGGECTTMSMLVSSVHPAKAGLQVPLLETLLDFGAAVDDRGRGSWTSPLMTALAFGYMEAAEALVRRGAKVDSLPAAAALGRLEEARRLLPVADAESRHRALALSAQHGRLEIVRLLLDAGEDPNRLNPEGLHAHSTPLHQAVCYGRKDVVEFLVERGARLDMEDAVWHGTPLGWAIHCEQPQIADYLRAQGNDKL